MEDNEINRELLCDWLETEGYEVMLTEDVEEACEENFYDAGRFDAGLPAARRATRAG